MFQFQLPDVDCAAVVAVAAFLLFLFCSFWLWYSSNARFHFSFTQATAKQAQKSNINTNLDTVMCAPLSLSLSRYLSQGSLSLCLARVVSAAADKRAFAKAFAQRSSRDGSSSERGRRRETALNANIETMFI